MFDVHHSRRAQRRLTHTNQDAQYIGPCMLLPPHGDKLIVNLSLKNLASISVQDFQPSIQLK